MRYLYIPPSGSAQGDVDTDPPDEILPEDREQMELAGAQTRYNKAFMDRERNMILVAVLATGLALGMIYESRS